MQYRDVRVVAGSSVFDQTLRKVDAYRTRSPRLRRLRDLLYEYARMGWLQIYETIRKYTERPQRRRFPPRRFPREESTTVGANVWKKKRNESNEETHAALQAENFRIVKRGQFGNYEQVTVMRAGNVRHGRRGTNIVKFVNNKGRSTKKYEESRRTCGVWKRIEKRELYARAVIRMRQGKAGSRSKFLNSENFKRRSKTWSCSSFSSFYFSFPFVSFSPSSALLFLAEGKMLTSKNHKKNSCYTLTPEILLSKAPVSGLAEQDRSFINFTMHDRASRH